ncbi:TetR/AcrR family transcriptional regulator [Flagellimonas amoyensis]|uniref:TetR/AcrR family transcriptional regulator n=1 Tax=Flagellimonas amoyensis TaxID=2169401 RepID=UPI000D3842C6|nr:TetR/AcrR family transcriptional regulator [Allomuricauda amoyensis]
MEVLMRSLKMGINDELYIKDPESSDLGKKIVEQSILLLDEVGFEQFTFKKLGTRIKSNESSIYRYFENKNKLLLYLASWHWAWMECRMVFETNGIPDPKEKLKRAIEILTQNVEYDSTVSHINESVLNKVIIDEYSKSLLVREVSKEKRDGYCIIYMRLVERLCKMIIAVDKGYPYPNSLASTVLEGTLYQYFLKAHFPALTDCDGDITPTDYFTDLVFRAIKK